MADEAAAADDYSQVYGPFHRLKGPTQSDGATNMQVVQQEIWGRPQEVRQHRPSASPAFLESRATPLADST